jgi:pimeloyl-ACP methyl ester carboxylesterase
MAMLKKDHSGRDDIGRFSSLKAREKFLRAYKDVLKLWPASTQELDVETRFATTHVLRYGPADGEPIILLHGASGNATTWLLNVTALGEHHPVFALDTPGDPGRSIPHQPIHPPAISAEWLNDVLDGLGIDRAHLIGSSYGGWLALNQTLHAPDRVLTSTLIDPGGLEEVGTRFFVWAYINGIVGLLPSWLLTGWTKRFRNPLLEMPELKRCVLLGALSYRTRRPAPLPLTDDELRSITTPTLLLLGEYSPLLRSKPVAKRTKALMRNVDVEIVSGTGHGPFLERPRFINERILTFVDRYQERPRS